MEVAVAVEVAVGWVPVVVGVEVAVAVEVEVEVGKVPVGVAVAVEVGVGWVPVVVAVGVSVGIVTVRARAASVLHGVSHWLTMTINITIPNKVTLRAETEKVIGFTAGSFCSK